MVMTAEATPGTPDDWRDEIRSDFAALRDGRPSAGDIPDLLREVDRLKAEVRGWEDWSNELAMLLPEDAETWPGVNPEGAQESIIQAALEHLLRASSGAQTSGAQ